MIDIQSILDPDCTRAGVEAKSRKKLMTRERLGSTGLGEGVAIPHCRIPCEHIHAAMLKLEHSVDYDSIDGKPVDLLFVLVVPPEETTAHLELLAELARLFGESTNREQLRASQSDAELYERLIGLFASRAA